MTVTINGTTGIAGVDGSAATPAVQGADTNTGIFFPAADTIAFTEGGTEAMRINSSGNVGIGTTTPSTKLHVAGELTLGPVSTEGGQVTFHNPDASTGLVIDVSAANNARIFNTTNNFNLQIGQIVGTGGTIDFYTNATSRAVINSSGDFAFNSGYGSAARAYGCRAWVNFDGTTNTAGFCTIRASGNVTSVADNGTGDYTVNFTTAMPDANYSAQVWAASSGSTSAFGAAQSSITAPTASALRFITRSPTPATVDVDRAQVSIFR
jgi:hypothetical protein